LQEGKIRKPKGKAKVKGCKNPSGNRSALWKSVQRRADLLWQATGDRCVYVLLPGMHNAGLQMATAGFSNQQLRAMLRGLANNIPDLSNRRRIEVLMDSLPGEQQQYWQ
jgi:hypothetical protein